MAEFGLTATGFNRKRLADIKAEKEAAFKLVFGDNINLNPQSNFGQIIGIESESEALVWELAELVYNAFYPSTAQGVQLSNLVTLNGIERRAATSSTVVLTLTGVEGTIIPAGSLVAIPNNTEQFETDLDIVIPVSGTIDVNATAINTGPIVATAGSITQIDTPVFGWQTVTNAADAIEGTNEETDSELRVRQQTSTQAAGQNLADALFGQLSNLDNVTSASVISNGTDATVDGIPPHQFLSIVQGGANSDIADIIWINTPQGISSFGAVTEQIVDSQGFPQDVKFSRPTEKDIYFDVVVTTDSNYPGSGDEDIKENILAFGQANSEIGDDVILSQFYTPVNEVPGVISIVIKISFTFPAIGTSNLTIAFDEIANYDLTFITVTSS